MNTSGLPEISDDILSYGEPDYPALTADEIIGDKLFAALCSIEDPLNRAQAESKAQARARELHLTREFGKCYKLYKAAAQPISDGGSNITEFTGQPITLKCGKWIADDRGVRIERNGRDGGTYYEFASPIPVLPVELLTNIESGGEKIKIMYNKSGWRSAVYDRSTVASTAKIIELANRGMEVNSENARSLVKYIADCVALNLDKFPARKSFSRLGWVRDGAFMPYDESLTFDGEKENKSLYEAVTPKGDYALWRTETAKWRKSIPMRLIMAASFASPLIALVDALPFVFHLWGTTGGGKTVSLMVAASIWGDPSPGKLVRTMNMTVNSMMETAAFLQSIPFFGDELQTIKSQSQNYDKLIMQVTEGIERGRMEYNTNRPTRSWQNSFVFSGEEPCTKTDSGGGVLNRVIEIECSGSALNADGNEIVNIIKNNHGHAGMEYVKLLTSDASIKERFNGTYKAVMEQTDAQEKQAASAALLLLADLYAAAYIYKEKPLSIDDIKPFLKSKRDIDTAGRAYDFVINLIARNMNRFKPNDFGEIPGEIWGRLEPGDREILINKDVLTRELASAGYDFDAVKKKWVEQDCAILSSQGYYAHQTKCHGIKASYVKIRLERDSWETLKPDESLRTYFDET